jgi:hypothetical protein
MKIIHGKIWEHPFLELDIKKLTEKAMSMDKPLPEEVGKWDETVKVPDWPLTEAMRASGDIAPDEILMMEREPAVVHFERLIRQLEAQGYKDHEIEAGLEQIVYDEFRGK